MADNQVQCAVCKEVTNPGRFCGNCGAPLGILATSQAPQPRQPPEAAPATEGPQPEAPVGEDPAGSSQNASTSRAAVMVVIGLVALVAVAVIAGIASLVTRFVGDDTRTLRGEFVVFEEGQKASGSCSTISRGYGDIGQGTDVVVSNPKGDELAFGKLGEGFATTVQGQLERVPAEQVGGESEKREVLDLVKNAPRPALNNGCRFEWEVRGIPSGESYYIVRIGRNRGEQRIEPDEFDETHYLSLGDMLNT